MVAADGTPTMIKLGANALRRRLAAGGHAAGLGDEVGYLVAGETLSSAALIDRYERLVTHFPIWSIEDGPAEDGWDGWSAEP